MRVSNYIKSEIIDSLNKAFGDCEIILFGSRVDSNKKGGDFDIAIKKDISKEKFKKGKIKFFKDMLFKDLDLPIDLVFYNQANSFLKDEIDKGIKLN